MSDTGPVVRAVEANLTEVSLAYSLASDLGLPNVGESLSDLHVRLLVTRAAMTRVSELVGDLVRIRGRIGGELVDRKGVLEEAEASVVTAKRFGVEDYTSAKEKNARLLALTLDDRRQVRQMERLAVDVDAALEYARTRHRELDRAVRDVDTRLRILSFEPR